MDHPASLLPNVVARPLAWLLASAVLVTLGCGRHQPVQGVPDVAIDPPTPGTASTPPAERIPPADPVAAAAAGDIEAAISLIRQARWNDLGRIDPRSPAILAWSTDTRRLDGISARQVHGEILANWAVRHPKEFADQAARQHTLRQALTDLLRDPIEDPIVLAEAAWLARDALNHQRAGWLTQTAMRLLLENIDGLEPELRLARLRVWSDQLDSLHVWPSWLDAEWKQARTLLASIAPDDLRLRTLLRLDQLLPVYHQVGNPVASAWPEDPDEWSRMEEMATLARSLGQQQVLAMTKARRTDLLMRQAASSDQAWDAATESARASIASLQLLSPEPHADLAAAHLTLAWCLHRGQAFAADQLAAAEAAYAAVARHAAAGREHNPKLYLYTPDPSHRAEANLRMLHGDRAPRRAVMQPPDLGINGWPFADHCRNYRDTEACRFGLYDLDRGDGLERAWHPGGTQLAHEGHWDQGRPTGLWRWWYADGLLAMEGTFTADGPQGMWRTWHANGQLYREVDLGAGGRFTGPVTTIDREGSRSEPTMWRDGRQQASDPLPRHGEHRYAYATVRGGGLLKDWLREGPWEEECDTSRTHSRIVYRHGLEHGPMRITHADGRVESGSMLAGMRHGPWLTMAAQGQTLESTEWVFGQRNGLHQTWDLQGRLRSRAIYASDHRTAAIEWDENGQVLTQHGPPIQSEAF